MTSKRYTGSSWIDVSYIKRWTGTEWREVTVQRATGNLGSSWEYAYNNQVEISVPSTVAFPTHLAGRLSVADVQFTVPASNPPDTIYFVIVEIQTTFNITSNTLVDNATLTPGSSQTYHTEISPINAATVTIVAKYPDKDWVTGKYNYNGGIDDGNGG